MDANEREWNNELLFKDEVFKIIGAGMAVSNTLGCGFLEAVYQEAMEIELEENKIPFEPQKRIQISYKGRVLKKEYEADFLCFDKIIVEIKIRQLIQVEDDDGLRDAAGEEGVGVGHFARHGRRSALQGGQRRGSGLEDVGGAAGEEGEDKGACAGRGEYVA